MKQATDAQKKFKRTITFDCLARIAAACYGPRLSGGFKALVMSRKSLWAKLNPKYLAWKLSHGYSGIPWVRTGKTLRAMSQGRVEPKVGTRKGLFFNVTGPPAFNARLEPASFKPDGKATPPPRVQARIAGALNFGSLGNPSKRRGRGGRGWKTGRVGRPLWLWEPSEEKAVAAAAEAELQKLVKEAGLA